MKSTEVYTLMGDDIKRLVKSIESIDESTLSVLYYDYEYLSHILQSKLAFSKIALTAGKRMEDGRSIFKLKSNDDLTQVGYLCIAISDFGKEYNKRDLENISYKYPGSKICSWYDMKYVYVGFELPDKHATFIDHTLNKPALEKSEIPLPSYSEVDKSEDEESTPAIDPFSKLEDEFMYVYIVVAVSRSGEIYKVEISKTLGRAMDVMKDLENTRLNITLFRKRVEV